VHGFQYDSLQKVVVNYEQMEFGKDRIGMVKFTTEITGKIDMSCKILLKILII